MEQKLKVRILRRLRAVYGEAQASPVLSKLEQLIGRYEGTIQPLPPGWSEKDALLIAYADSILQTPEAPLRTLHQFLRAHAGESFTFVHLLPFYPFTSDDGFSVTDYRAVRPELGTWDDIRAFARDYRLVFDGVVNHVSASGHYMREYGAGNPAYADFFIALNPKTDTSSVLRTRNLPLLHDYPTRDGIQWLWTTFSRDQVDLNFRNPQVLLEIMDVLLFYARNGAAVIRLDAIPYLWKQLGTSCAHLPQTHELIKLFHDVFQVVAPHVLLLTETNVPHRENITYFGNRGDEAQMIYNFALAPLVLWSLVKGDASVLTRWAGDIEKIGDNATYLNITATHDGIGMRPTEGLLSENERSELVQLARDHNGDVTGKRNPDGSISPYELNLNYFDAVNDPNSAEPLDLQIRRFILSQAIPLAMIGIPGIYIHSLLGSRNDQEGVKRTGRARSINREQLQADRLRAELGDPLSLRARVFTAIRNMLAIRARQSAFHPDAGQEVLDLGSDFFALRRFNVRTGQTLLAIHNVTSSQKVLPSRALERQAPWRDALTGDILVPPAIPFDPYRVLWLELPD